MRLEVPLSPILRRSLLWTLVLLLVGAPASIAAEARLDGLDSVAMPALREGLRGWDGLAQAWFRLAAGDADGARRDVLRLMGERAPDPNALHLLGITAAAAGRRMQSEQALRRSLRLRPDGWVALHLISSLLDRGRTRAASSVLRQQSARLADDAQLARASAWIFVAQGELQQARALLEALESTGRSAPLAWQLSGIYTELGETEAALAAIRRAVGQDPGHPAYRRELFARLESARDWAGLVAATGEAGADAVGGGLAPYYRGLGLLRLGRPDEAVAAFSAVLEHGRPEPTAVASVAGHLLQLGEYATAERAARLALAARGEDASLHHLLAMTLTRLDRESEALAHYRRSAELGAADAGYRFDLAASLCALQRGAELLDVVSRARKDFPDDARFEELSARCAGTLSGAG